MNIANNHVLVNVSRMTTNRDEDPERSTRLEEERMKAGIKRVQTLFDRIWDEDLPTMQAMHNQVVERAYRIQELIGELV